MDLVILEPHNEAQAGDDLTTIAVNYLWRRHIVEALCLYFEPLLTQASVDDDVQTTLNNFNALIVDLYDTEVLLENNPRLRTFGVGSTLGAGVNFLCAWQTISSNSNERWNIGDAFAQQSSNTRFANVSGQTIYVHVDVAVRITSASASVKTVNLFHSVLGRIARATVNANVTVLELTLAADVRLLDDEYLYVEVSTGTAGDWDAQSSVFKSYFNMHRIG